MKKIQKIITYLIVFIAISYLIFKANIDPQIKKMHIHKFDAPQPQQFNFDKNVLNDAQVLTQPLLNPQDLAIDSKNNIYTGNKKGQILQITPDKKITIIAKDQTINEIYGIVLSKDQSILYFVTSKGGLCSLNLNHRQKKIDCLVYNFQGKRIISLNGLDIDQSDNNIIYMTQPSPDLPIQQYGLSLTFANAPIGRILSFNIKTKEINVVAEHLYYPNGIVSQPESQSILVSEMGRHRILRVYTKGEKKGVKEIFKDNLPGVCDNLKLSYQGDLWVGIPMLRDQTSTYIDRSVTMRQILAYLPQWALNLLINIKYTGGIKIDRRSGNIIQSFIGSHKKTKSISTVIEKNGNIFCGSWISPTILSFHRK